MTRFFFYFGLSCLSLSPVVFKGQTSIDSSAIKRAQAQSEFQLAKEQMAVFEMQHGHFIETANGKMHYLTFGSPANVPLLWSGGSGMNAYELLMFGEELDKAGYFLITIDYYGQGQTPIPAKEVSLWNVADDMKAILDALKIEKAVVGGWSRGGTISTVFYDAYPERVLGLILEDGGSVAWNANDHKLPVSEIEKKTTRRFQEEKPEPFFESEFETYYAAHPKEGVHRFFILNGISKDASGKWGQRVGLNSFYSEDNADKKLKITLRPMDAPLYAASAQLVEPRIVYRNLHVPMLILDPVSEKDNFDFSQGNSALQKMHPDLIQHKIYENTPHHLKFVKKTMFLQDMNAFLIKIKDFHHLK